MKHYLRNQRGSILMVEFLVLGIVIAIGGFTYVRVSQANKNAKVDVGAPAQHAKKPTMQPPPPIAAAKGTIKGALAYPSSSIPAQKICAIEIGQASNQVCVDEPAAATAYQLDVMPGSYYVYAQLKEKSGDITTAYKAYYDEYVTCGSKASCPAAGHQKYVSVKVASGATVGSIDPTDWYDSGQMAQ